MRFDKTRQKTKKKKLTILRILSEEKNDMGTYLSMSRSTRPNGLKNNE